MNLPEKFQTTFRVINLPTLKCPPPFSGLAARCGGGKVLSVDYIPLGQFDEVEFDPQGEEETVNALEEQLTKYFGPNPKSACFGDLLPQFPELRGLEEDELSENILHKEDECREVLKEIRKISCGTVLAYSEIGERIGRHFKAIACDLYPNGSTRKALGKAVADICSANPLGILIPCFRAVSIGEREGIYQLGGFGRGHEFDISEEKAREIKAWFLEHERGVVVERFYDEDGTLLPESRVRNKSA